MEKNKKTIEDSDRPIKDKLERIKSFITIISSIVTIFGIIIGGYWSYTRLFQERKPYPHGKISQKVSHIPLSNEINLMHIKIGLTNTGNTILLIKKGVIRINQILPIIPNKKNEYPAIKQVNDALNEFERKEDNFSWVSISERNKIFEPPLDIEPGEEDVIDFEFAIPSNVKVVRVYSYFKNEEKTKNRNEVGWVMTTYYDFKTAEKEK